MLVSNCGLAERDEADVEINGCLKDADIPACQLVKGARGMRSHIQNMVIRLMFRLRGLLLLGQIR